MTDPDSPTPAGETKILEIAERIVTEEGEDALTMEHLAQQSGASRTTLYRLFGSRKELLTRLAARPGVQIASPEQGQDIRARILTATHAVLSATGSTQFTLEQVADQAGLGVATIYRHFGTKENLLRDLSTTLYHPRRAARELFDQPSGDVQRDLEEFVCHVVQFMHSMGEIPRMLFSGDARMRELFQMNRSEQERTLTNLTRYLEEQIRAGQIKGGDPFDLAAALMGMIIGFVFIKPSYTKTQDSPETIAHRVVGVFLSGVRTGDR